METDGYRLLLLSDYELALIIRIDGTFNDAIDGLKTSIDAMNEDGVNDWAAGESAVYQGFENLHNAYLQSNEALNFRYFDTETHWFKSAETSKIKHHFYAADSVQMNILSNNLFSMNFNGARRVIHDIADNILQKSKTVFYYNIPILFAEIFDMIMKSLRANHIPATPLYYSSENAMFNLNRATSLVHEVEIMDEILTIAEEYVADRTKTSKISNVPMSVKFKEYVEENLRQWPIPFMLGYGLQYDRLLCF